MVPIMIVILFQFILFSTMKSEIKVAKNVRCKKINYFKRNLTGMDTQLNLTNGGIVTLIEKYRL